MARCYYRDFAVVVVVVVVAAAIAAGAGVAAPWKPASLNVRQFACSFPCRFIFIHYSPPFTVKYYELQLCGFCYIEFIGHGGMRRKGTPAKQNWKSYHF